MNSPNQAIQRWRAAPLPEGHPTNDELDKFKAELAYWDTMIAGDIISFSDSGKIQPGVLNYSAGLSELRSLIESRRAKSDREDQEYIETCLEYLELLADAWLVVKTASASSEQSGPED
jgi:hypothetical protein